MGFIDGLRYHFIGLRFAFRNYKLLFWGLFRFFFVILVMVFFMALVFAHNQELMNFLWPRPESRWILWLWYLLSWLISFLLLSFSAILSYVISQILFSVWVMDLMSEITELKSGGTRIKQVKTSIWFHFLFLLKQEIPRGISPVILSFLLLIAGWIIPLGSILLVFSSLVAILFLAWDNTDLLPARHKIPFKERFRFLLRTIPFHLGFGLPFLVPGLNIFFLSFAPVGATLYHMDKRPIQKKN